MHPTGQSLTATLNDAVRRGLSGIALEAMEPRFEVKTRPMRLRAHARRGMGGVREIGSGLVWTVALCVVGACGGNNADKAQALCAHLEKRCGADAIEPSCAKDVAELAEPMGESYGKTIDCGIAAASCPEIIGCFAGGLGATVDRWKSQFDKGVDKMRDQPDKPGVKPDPKRPPDSGKPIAGWDDPKSGKGRDFDNVLEDIESRMEKALDSDPFKKRDVLSKCTTFKGENATIDGDQRVRAGWAGCPDNIERVVRCATFVGTLKCDCLEDGVKKWFFSAESPRLDDRAAAERIALANCAMSFGD